MRIEKEETIIKCVFGMMAIALLIMVLAASQITPENSCCCVCETDQDSKPESGRYK
ncbi:hypothetical protein KAR91_17395 [Candidatus Pacearchaeota archaeon]|nr:hypothetical protein [Candidatus Pacearchaeota archaeon]